VTGSPAGAAETVICTLPAMAIVPNQAVDFWGMADITLAAGTTGNTVNIRRGTGTTGTVVATVGPIAVTASTRILFAILGTDTQAGEEAGQQYVLTVTLAAAAAGSTVNNVCLTALWGALGTAFG
jgi:hypothetical protein